MPLVVPGITSSLTGSNDDKGVTEWQSKLLGKKIGSASDNTSFAKQDLPGEHRVIEHGSMATMDHKPDRLNVHLGQDGTVEKVTKG